MKKTRQTRKARLEAMSTTDYLKCPTYPPPFRDTDPRHCREHDAWAAMKARCMNPKSHYYHRYGGRGIVICERWLNSFANFLADMGPRPEGTSLDRIDNNGNYEPGNCRWATQKEQMRNMSRNRSVTAFGETRLMCEWEEIAGLTSGSVSNRLRNGWSPERAVGPPTRRPPRR